jgi:formylglycine-generating enzyme required for sulfatase activity
MDLTGNVWEWEDSCSPASPYDLCHVRGGAFSVDRSFMTCHSNYGGTLVGSLRNDAGPALGFRCCSSP